MAQATTVNQRSTTLSVRPLFAGLAVAAFLATIVLAAMFVPGITAPETVQPRSEAVLESGRAWQRQYESMSGLEARRERHAEAVLESGRQWQAYQQQISGE